LLDKAKDLSKKLGVLSPQVCFFVCERIASITPGESELRRIPNVSSNSGGFELYIKTLTGKTVTLEGV